MNPEQIVELNKYAARYGLEYSQGGSLAFEFMPLLMIEMMKELNDLCNPQMVMIEHDNGITEYRDVNTTYLSDAALRLVNKVAYEQYGMQFDSDCTTYAEFISLVVVKLIEDLAELRSLTGNS